MYLFLKAGYGLSLYQLKCLQMDGVLHGKNLVYCASTSAGKSLVAELLLVRRLQETGKKGLLVLPYVALCAEKVSEFGQWLCKAFRIWYHQ